MSPKAAIGVSLFGFALDRGLKYFALNTPILADRGFMFGNAFGFRLHLNDAFAWSLPVPNNAALGLAAAALLVLVFLLIKKCAHPEWAGLVLVFFGALSNAADRILYGGVVDYLAVPFGGVVNIADALIVAGVVLLVLPRTKYAH
ncbi:MAG: signal peptidase II [Candidatus Sungbacteria bacterium]|uniref:Signal peptidase II n=1 Tax=Candidatus Sungiibacteriota bacterium TaxID=2750080 RepID=A0A932YZ30_9BACT|nr:signal peptidase II [Parcubacteria group bacterium]MBI2636973.1 signal peptidase II [Parcubacteria group bacterium]MBI4132936.1 signal peptidase II [Candidatus Sungbacteria bacterium]